MVLCAEKSVHKRRKVGVVAPSMDTLMEVDEDDSVPEEIEEQCLQCHESLVATDGLLKPVLSVGRAQLEEKVC